MSNPQILFGGLNVGSGKFNTEPDVSSLLAVLQSLGIHHIDTAAVYPNACPGKSEQLLGESSMGVKNFIIDTKIMVSHPMGKETLRAGNINASIMDSLQRLKTKINTLYCHTPDPCTPVKETATELDRHYKMKNFKKLGLSNYNANQIEEYIKVCEHEGLVKPSFIQGQYNMLLRSPESDLLPILRKHNLSFIAYSPLAGGFLTGLFTKGVDLEGTRFEKDNKTGDWYKRTYDRVSMHSAVTEFRKQCEQRELRMTEVALRWLYYHSELNERDGIILGASSEDQIKQNMEDISRGALQDDIVAFVNSILGSVNE